jgi:hemerythrin
MAVVVWDPRLETGIDVIDAQHRTLFEAVNTLGDSFKSGQAAYIARESLDFLAKYSIEHFQTEERFMRSMNYPDLDSHRIEHGRLVSQLQALQVKHDKGYLVTAEVALFVADWLKHHIQEADMGYVRFIQTRPMR